jgi:hypothetical protein
MKFSKAKPAVFVSFRGNEIHAELGRYVFTLLNAFATSGYTILLADNTPVERLGLYAAQARSFPGVSVTTTVPDRTSEKIYLFDVEDRDAGKRKWLRKIQIRFDVFSPHWFRRAILMPFPIHPVHVTPDLRDRLTRLRSGKRRMRVFFSGDMEGYTQRHIRYPGPKLPRLDVINSVRQQLGDRVLFVRDQDTLDGVLAADYVSKCVILDTTKLRIPDQDWLTVLSMSDFFLAPPGIVMPMCHNSVEALAVGAIPVINYGEWFDPPLQSLRNCVAFDQVESLISGLQAVLATDEAQIADMRVRAITYYDSVLSTRAFMTRIESSANRNIDVLIMTERYVAQNAHRLTSRSLLIRGSYDQRQGPLERIRGIMRS